MSGTGAGSGGPLCPADATGGWEPAGTPDAPWLVKDYGEYRGRVTRTAGATCVWRVGRPDGSMLRESSARGVEEAKALADAWVARARGQAEGDRV
ncbi:hypothetical protein [Nocardia aurantia]|uniref:hypothetical protein n=1 Tax=Nocardia aurantia TaxID=2585199 RepID=UPI0012957B83|nr:hypothetical protein [Nocardia aurantia]